MALPWGAAVLEILQRGDIAQADVARRVGVTGAVLNRLLHGVRRPTPAMVTRVNNAISDIFSYVEIADYLGIVDLLERRPFDADFEAFATAAFDSWRDGCSRYLRDGYDLALQKDAGLWHQEKRIRFIAEMIALRRRWALGMVDGAARRVTYFEYAIRIFDAYEFEWRRWLRPAAEVRAAHAVSRFFNVVEKSLGKATSDVSLRNDLTLAIAAAFNDVRFEISGRLGHRPTAKPLPWDIIDRPRTAKRSLLGIYRRRAKGA